MPSVRRCVSTVALVVLCGAPLGAEEQALLLSSGSVARRQLVAVGRDLVVDGEALSHVAALDGSVRITGRVGGDVIVLGGDVHVGTGGEVLGDVFVLGGVLEVSPGADLRGKAVAYPSVSRAWMTLLEGPSIGLDASSALVVGAKLALLTAWLALALVLFASTGRELLSTSLAVTEEPLRLFGIGLTAVLAMTLTALFFSLFAASLVGLPLLVLVVLLAFVLKLWGMVAVFHAVGGWLARRLTARRLLPLNGAAIGLLVLGALKLLPWVGLWVWWVASFVGIGAALATKFGRREPWLQTA